MTDMNRIEARMNACSKKQEKAFITYITAGLPDLAATKEIIRAQERGGCDVIELGVPFSDPVADGPVIQDASYRAIFGGVNVKKIFAMMQELRTEGVTVPIIFMMYYNTILHYGVEAFVKRCNEAGVDGLIVPDLPFEEQEDSEESRRGAGIRLLRIVHGCHGTGSGVPQGGKKLSYCSP